jgi:hypothetical protein
MYLSGFTVGTILATAASELEADLWSIVFIKP